MRLDEADCSIYVLYEVGPISIAKWRGGKEIGGA